MNLRRELAAELGRVLGPGNFRTEVEMVALLYSILEELRGLRRDLTEWRSAVPNAKSDRQREAEARMGQTLEEFFAQRAGASVSDLAKALGVSKSTAHAWRGQRGGR